MGALASPTIRRAFSNSVARGPAAGCCARTTQKVAKAATAHVTDRHTSPILRVFITPLLLEATRSEAFQ
jgi:hypothetical protein